MPEPRKVSETRPLYATTLVNLHVHERGSVVIPRETRGDDLLVDRDANLPEAAWRVLCDHFGLTGHRRDDDARHLTGKLLRAALAILHAPAYQADHRSALSADWAHLPVPKDAGSLEQMAESGELVGHLLNADREARDDVFAVLNEGRSAQLGQLHKLDGSPVRTEDLLVTVNYWGGAKGRWIPRLFASNEEPLPEWGGRTGDLYISEQVFFANVPEAVWKYELGGYPVLKKWLGYRQANRRDGKPLSAEERSWFRAVVQRIAALLALSPKLDELYSAAAENAFTATELAIER